MVYAQNVITIARRKIFVIDEQTITKQTDKSGQIDRILKEASFNICYIYSIFFTTDVFFLKRLHLFKTTTNIAIKVVVCLRVNLLILGSDYYLIHVSSTEIPVYSQI